MKIKKSTMFFLFVVSILLMPHLPSSAQEKTTTTESLRGLNGVHVVVSVLDSTFDEAQLNQALIQSDVERRLQAAGVRVLTREEAIRTPGTPYLYVTVNAIGTPNELYSYSVETELNQWVSMLRNGNIRTYAPTWSTEAMGMTGEVNLEKVVRGAVERSTDRFIEAYRGVNSQTNLRGEPLP